MDSSSSSSSPLFPITNIKPLWDSSTSNSMENSSRVFTLNSQEISSNYNYTNFNYAGAGADPPTAEREHMFDKVVTPSDVGKLNRLVIPKQHAEKYFPMDSSGNDKGLVLDFTDRNGKPWRFRYSYWNSSQSYVMTKGWSRFVKEKKLDAGDVVSFHRGIGEIARDVFYIDWRRRPAAPPPEFLQIHHGFALHHSIHPPFLRAPPPPPFFHHQLAVQDHRQLVSVIEGYSLRDATPHLQMQVRDGGPENRIVETVGEPVVFESVPVVHGNAVAKRLRLFGVNMDCGVSNGQQGDCRVSPEAEDGRLKLKLHGGVSMSSSSSTSITTIDFLEKGKSPSMSLDFDI